MPGPAKAIMHNMNYKGFYLPEQLLSELEFSCALYKTYTRGPNEKNTPRFHGHCVCVFPFALPSSQFFLNREKEPQTSVWIPFHSNTWEALGFLEILEERDVSSWRRPNV